MLERSSGFARDAGETEKAMGWKSDTGKKAEWEVVRGLLESTRVVEQGVLAKNMRRFFFFF